MSSAGRDTSDAYRAMLRVARKVTSSEDDARDLVQDALVVALQRGIGDWASSEHRAWLFGVLRKRSAFLTRSRERRRRRERIVPLDAVARPAWTWHSDFLAALPRSLRTVASLARAELSAPEIRWVLDLSPTAFRARLSALGRRVRRQEELPVEASATEPAAWGALRAPVLKQLKKLPNKTMATHDPDGHVLFFRMAAHKSGTGGNE